MLPRPPLPAACHDNSRAVFLQIDTPCSLLRAPRHNRTHRHRKNQIAAILARLLLPPPRLPIRRHVPQPTSVVLQRHQILIRLQHHIAALAAVTAIRPAEGHIFLTTERDGTAAAVSTTDVNVSLVDHLFRIKVIDS